MSSFILQKSGLNTCSPKFYQNFFIFIIALFDLKFELKWTYCVPILTLEIIWNVLAEFCILDSKLRKFIY